MTGIEALHGQALLEVISSGSDGRLLPKDKASSWRPPACLGHEHCFPVFLFLRACGWKVSSHNLSALRRWVHKPEVVGKCPVRLFTLLIGGRIGGYFGFQHIHQQRWLLKAKVIQPTSLKIPLVSASDFLLFSQLVALPGNLLPACKSRPAADGNLRTC